jgi:signal transduction histidine kinase
VEKAIYLRKLHDIFLIKFLSLFIILFLILGLIIYFWAKHIYVEKTKQNLIDNINIIALNIDQHSDFNKKAIELSKSTNLRVTFIAHDGSILGESDKDPSTMDNHAKREEIIQADFQEYGFVIRPSDTVHKNLLYVAKKFALDTNDQYYIRISEDIDKISNDFLYLSLKVGCLFLIFILIAFFIALQISKKIQIEITMIVKYLYKIKKHQKIKISSSSFSFEFAQITDLLEDVSKSLSKKEKQKSKYTAKLKLANRQKDDIISAISHEFKNPIAVINGYSQTLLDDETLNTEIRQKFLHKITSNSLKLTELIDRLRLSLKLEEGKYEQSFSKTNIYTLCENIIDDLHISYPHRNILLSGKEDMTLDIDETMFKIAIANLIENALKYSQDDVFVTVTSKNLSVQDSGIGIEAKDIPKITNRFYRASKNGWDNSLGIGLSLVKNILKLHQYTLEIQSIENEGSTFTILFKN